MELYPQDYGYECIDGVVDEIDVNEPQRAAFMQCFDLMPPGSLPMTREECKDWIEKKYQEVPGFIWNASVSCLALYDHLASLSSAAQPATGSDKVD